MVEDLLAEDPRSVGPYRLLGRLGAGGMGQVFLGRSAGGRLVAVKVIRPELAGDPGFRARFAREVTAARTVSGLFTALVADADPEGSVPWLATAYVAGPSLAAAVEDQGPLPVASVLTLAGGLAEGLAAVHAAGVVHRDLKPSNVLLADDGPRVIDFGISRAAEASVLTQTGMVMGSPGFMSPEQAEGREVGPPSDVFSLGAVLAFAATGEGPFGKGSTPALMYRVVYQQPDTARLPGPVRPLVERCMAKDPGQRPTTADLLAELGAAEPEADWLPAELTQVFGRYAAPPAESTGGPLTMTSAQAPRTPTVAALGGQATQAAGQPAEAASQPTQAAGQLAGAASPPAQAAGQPGQPDGQPPRKNRRGLVWGLVATGVLALLAVVAILLPHTINGSPVSHTQQATTPKSTHSSSSSQHPRTEGTANQTPTPTAAPEPSPSFASQPTAPSSAVTSPQVTPSRTVTPTTAATPTTATTPTTAVTPTTGATTTGGAPTTTATSTTVTPTTATP